MAGDFTTQLDVIINIVTEGADQFDELADNVKESADEISSAGGQINEALDETKENIQETGESAQEASFGFEQLTSAGLGLLFTARFVNQQLQPLVSRMFDIGGASSILSGRLTQLLTPAAEDLGKTISNLTSFIGDLSKEQKVTIGNAILLGSALASVLAVVGLVAAGIGGIVPVLGTVSGALSGVLAVSLSSLILIVGVLVAAFTFFGDTVAAIAQGVIDALFNLANIFINLVQGDFAGAADAFFNLISDAIDNTIKIFGAFIDDLLSIPGAIIEFGASLVDSIVQGIKDNIGVIKDVLVDAVAFAIPGVSGDMLRDAGGAAMDFASGALDFVTGNDFVLSDGKMVRTHPNDTIIGMRNPEELGAGGGGGGNVTVNVDADLRDGMDVDQMVDRIERRINRSTTGRSGLR